MNGYTFSAESYAKQLTTSKSMRTLEKKFNFENVKSSALSKQKLVSNLNALRVCF